MEIYLKLFKEIIASAIQKNVDFERHLEVSVANKTVLDDSFLSSYIEKLLKEGAKQEAKPDAKSLFIHELLYSESDEERESLPYEKVLKKAQYKEVVEDSTESKSSKRGRPKILQLLSRIKDSNVVKMVKDLYSRMFKMAIEKATQLIQYLSCFYCALFSYCEEDGETPCGKVKHFWSILDGKIRNLPALRTLQDRIKWLIDKKKIFFKCAKSDLEALRHKAWERMQDKIQMLIGEVAPVYFM